MELCVISNNPGTVTIGNIFEINSLVGGLIRLNILANGLIKSKENVNDPINGVGVGVGVISLSRHGTYPFGLLAYSPNLL